MWKQLQVLNRRTPATASLNSGAELQRDLCIYNIHIYIIYTLHIFVYIYIYEQLYTYYITMFTYSINGLTIKESSQSLEFPILQIRCGAPNGLTRWHWKGKKSPTVPHPEMVCWGPSKKKTVEFLEGFKSKEKKKEILKSVILRHLMACFYVTMKHTLGVFVATLQMNHHYPRWPPDRSVTIVVPKVEKFIAHDGSMGLTGIWRPTFFRWIMVFM